MGCLLSKSTGGSKPEKSKVNEQDKEIAQLKVTRDKVNRYLKKLESNIDSCQSVVKQCVKNKEKENAQSRQYKKDNPEKIKNLAAEYYRKNRGKILRSARDYRKKNADKRSLSYKK
mgnify:CR=1 FL=1